MRFSVAIRTIRVEISCLTPRAAGPPWRKRPLPGDQLPVPSQDRVGVTMVATASQSPSVRSKTKPLGHLRAGPPTQPSDRLSTS
jgi:hypothetical protein